MLRGRFLMVWLRLYSVLMRWTVKKVSLAIEVFLIVAVIGGAVIL